jgi:hypothetical protein
VRHPPTIECFVSDAFYNPLEKITMPIKFKGSGKDFCNGDEEYIYT